MEYKVRKEATLGALSEQVEALMQRERYAEAIRLFRRRASDAKNDWRLTWNWGWCYFKLDNYRTARVHLRRATQLATENAICYWAYGQACSKAGNYQAAKSALIKALSLKDSYLARLSLALVYMKAGEIEKAEYVHLEGIKLKPDDAKRHKAYADFLGDVGRRQEARQVRRKARDIAWLQEQGAK